MARLQTILGLFLSTAVLICLCAHTALALNAEGSAGPLVAQSQRRTVAVALMHRHGARTGPQITPAGLTWGDAVLSPVGAEMALALGGWLREHYTQTPATNATRDVASDGNSDWAPGGIFCAPDPSTGEIPLSSETCIGRDYSVKQVISQSTYFERTIRTGIGLLRGMFSNDSYGIPFVQHSPANTDMKLGYYYSWPSANMHTEAIDAYNPTHDNQTLLLMTQSELDEVGVALQSLDRCHTQQTLCILLAQDVTSCNYANNPQTPDSPDRIPDALKRYWPRFRMAQQRSNAFLYMYNNPSQQPDSYKASDPKSLLQSSELWERTGSFGRIFTREVASRFTERLSAFAARGAARRGDTAATPNYVPLLFHYSAHDVTIYGAQVAMGGITVSDMYAPTDSPWPEGTTEYDDMVSFLVPEFASVLMFDLFDDGNVSVSFAKPPQVYGANFSNYTVLSNKVVRMTCMREDGSLYRVTECPLPDFTRYTDYTKPAKSFVSVALPEQSGQQYDNYDSYGYCYALQEDLASTGCSQSSTVVPTNANCILYRTVCPSFACDSPRYVLNQTTLACTYNVAPKDSSTQYKMMYGGSRSPVSRWFYAGTIVGSLCIGIVFGFLSRVGLFERSMRKQLEEQSGASKAGDVLHSSGAQTYGATAHAASVLGAATEHPVVDRHAASLLHSQKQSPVGSQMVSALGSPDNGAEKKAQQERYDADARAAAEGTAPIDAREQRDTSDDDGRPPLALF